MTMYNISRIDSGHAVARANVLITIPSSGVPVEQSIADILAAIEAADLASNPAQDEVLIYNGTNLDYAKVDYDNLENILATRILPGPTTGTKNYFAAINDAGTAWDVRELPTANQDDEGLTRYATVAEITTGTSQDRTMAVAQFRTALAALPVTAFPTGLRNNQVRTLTNVGFQNVPGRFDRYGINFRWSNDTNTFVDIPRPPAQVRPDWNASSGLASIANKPGEASATEDGLLTAANFIKLQEVIEDVSYNSNTRVITFTRFDGQNPVTVALPAPTPPGSGISEARANQLIQAALAAAVTGNTETGITVTYNNDGTIDFVVTAQGGTPAPSAHQRYAAYGSDGTFTAADFTGSGFGGTVQDIAITGATGQNLYLAFWSAMQLTSITAPFSLSPSTNHISEFTRTALRIGSTDGFRYVSTAGDYFPAGINTTWRLN